MCFSLTGFALRSLSSSLACVPEESPCKKYALQDSVYRYFDGGKVQVFFLIVNPLGNNSLAEKFDRREIMLW